MEENSQYFNFNQQLINLNDHLKCTLSVDSNTLLDCELINKNIGTMLKLCIERENQSNYNKREFVLEIIDKIASHPSYSQNFRQIIDSIMPFFTEENFDGILNIFQHSCPKFALRTVNALIRLARTSLHHNLKIINSMLQIIELGFKHSDSEVKAISYDCWKALIQNFALERDFLLKTKKLNLIMMPLINKCKSYKEENVSQRKILAWLCLIQSINEQIVKHYNKVLIPFFNYCFGLPIESTSDESETNEEKIQKFLTSKFEPMHQLKSLNHIGFELLLTLIFNSQYQNLNDKILKFSCVDSKINYGIQDMIKEESLCLHLLKYFFEIFLSEGSIIQRQFGLEAWKCLYKLLGLSINTERLISQNQSKAVYYFSKKSVEFINSASLEQYNCVDIDYAHMMLSILKIGNETLSNNEKIKSNQTNFIEKMSNIIFKSVENDQEKFLCYFAFIINFIETNNVVDLCLWIYFSTKLTDFLKGIKQKNIQIYINKSCLEAINSCALFPFKYFRLLKHYNENEAKLNVSMNVTKAYYCLLKQNKIRFDEFLQSSGNVINSWVSSLFDSLISSFDDHHDFTMLVELTKFWAGLPKSKDSQATIEFTLKLLQLNSQFILFIFQNIYDFDFINKNYDLNFVNELDSAFSILSKMECQTKRIEPSLKHLASAIDYIIKIIDLFHKSLMANSKSISEIKENSSSIINSCQIRIETKQTVQIFNTLIEIVTFFFVKIKSSKLLSELLMRFAGSIEQLSELGVFSRQAQPLLQATNRNINQFDISSHHPHHNSHTQMIISLQPNRKSNELFDSLATQVIFHFQTNLIKTYAFHQFDSGLLSRLEPIIFSFLKHTHKPALKHKMLQAWNISFGKSTVTTLNYSGRLEKLFMELREEMVSSNKLTKSNQNTTTPLVLSLPCFKPIVLDTILNQSQTTMNSSSSVLNVKSTTIPTKLVEDEKENKVPNDCLKNNFSALKKSSRENSTGSLDPDYLINEISSSECVPIARLMGIEKQHSSLNHSENTEQINNFVFSPIAGRRSFLTQKSSSSASKAESLWTKTTPENQNQVRASPRSLRSNNPKRKLDLDRLIDQLPDKEFTTIKKNNTSFLIGNVVRQNSNIKIKTDSSRKRAPLTEHQKEVRKQKAFIPLEMQSVFSSTNDSQSAFTIDDDTNTQSSNLFVPTESRKDDTLIAKQPQQSPSQLKNSEPLKINSKSIEFHEKMDIDLPLMDDENKIEPKRVLNLNINEENKNESSTIKSQVFGTIQPAICFYSKKNPEKQIRLIEVNQIIQTFSPEKSLKPQKEINSDIKFTPILDDSIKTSHRLSKDSLEKDETNCTPKRRSMRLSLKQQKEIQGLSPNKEENNPDERESEKQNLDIKQDQESVLTQSCARSLKNELVTSLDEISTRFEKTSSNEKFSRKNINTSSRSSKNKIIMQERKKFLKPMRNFGKSSKRSLILKLQKNSKLSGAKKLLLIKNLRTSVVNAKKINPSMFLIKKSLSRLNKRKESLNPENKKITNPIDTTIVEVEDEDDIPLAKFIEMKKLEISSKPSLNEPSELNTSSNNNTDKNEQILNNNAARILTTTDELIQKLNSTPTTSILKRKLLNKIGEVSPMLSISLNQAETASNDTPTKRRVSFCESVRVEEIEPNFNKTVFFRTTIPKNKAKIVLSPFFNQKQHHQQISINSCSQPNMMVLNQTNILQPNKSQSKENTDVLPTNSDVNLSQNFVENDKSKPLPIINDLNSSSSYNVSQGLQIKVLNHSVASGQMSPIKNSNCLSTTSTGSPATSLIDFFSFNKQSLLSQRSNMIQQQMQASKSSDFALSSNVQPLNKTILLQAQNGIAACPSLIFDSPKSGEITSPILINTPGYPRLSQCKLPIDILFDQIDTSLYLNKIGTYKYFRFKNVLTLGDLCSLSINSINSFPFRIPKLENYYCMIKNFEEKCAEKIKRFDSGQIHSAPNIPDKQSLVSMGSVEEEMEKLESSSSYNLDTSIENEGAVIESITIGCSKTNHEESSIHINGNEQAEINDRLPDQENLNGALDPSEGIRNKTRELRDIMNQIELKYQSIENLLKLSESIDSIKNEFDDCCYTLQASIREKIKTMAFTSNK